MQHLQGSVDPDLLADLGIDLEDPRTQNTIADTEAYFRLIDTLVGMRRDQKLAQKVVAERMETTQSRVSDIERLSGDPRISTLFRYARAVDGRLRVNVVPTNCGWDRPDVQTLVVPTTTTVAAEAEDLDTLWAPVKFTPWEEKAAG